MTRLPINLLLGVCILALLAGIGLQAKGVLDDRERVRLDQDKNLADFMEKVELGRVRAGDAVTGPNYAEPTAFWNAVKDVNLIGKEPPKPVQVGGDVPKEPDQPVELPKVPLADILSIVFVVSDADKSILVVQYRPEANVTPPAELVGAAGGPPAIGDTVPVAAPNPRIPNNRGRGVRPAAPGRVPGSAVPTGGAGANALYQQLRIGDTLWPEYDYIRLVRVSEDATHAFFVREDPAVDQSEWAEEPLYREALGLDQETLAALQKGLPDRANAGGVAPVESPAGPAEPTTWQPTASTTEVSPNRFDIGTRDRAVFRSDPNRVFNQDVGTESWSSRSGNVRGVRITQLAPGYERYGVQVGEIILAVNGEPVTGKPEAMRIGRKLYDRGVRTFEVEFLTTTGRRITRTYVAPDE